MFSFEVGQAEDDVVRVRDGHAQALEEKAEEVGPAISGLDRGVVGGQGKADMNFERRKM